MPAEKRHGAAEILLAAREIEKVVGEFLVRAGGRSGVQTFVRGHVTAAGKEHLEWSTPTMFGMTSLQAAGAGACLAEMVREIMKRNQIPEVQFAPEFDSGGGCTTRIKFVYHVGGVKLTPEQGRRGTTFEPAVDEPRGGEVFTV